jgi:hypothetical protein
VTPNAQWLRELVSGYRQEFVQVLGSQEGVTRAALSGAIQEADIGGQIRTAISEAIDDTTFTVDLDFDRLPTAGAQLTDNSAQVKGQGLARFPNLSIDRAGRGFTLEASVEQDVVIDLPVIEVEVVVGEATFSHTVSRDDLEAATAGTSEPSEAFSIFEQVTDCGARTCSVRSTEGDRFTIDIDTPASAGFLALSISGEDLSDEGLCGGVPYRGLPDAVHFDAVDVDAAKRATILIDKGKVQEDVNNGRAHYDVCFIGDASFTAKGGQPAPTFDDPIGELTHGPALLEDCHRLPAGSEGDPCIEARTGASGGRVRLVVQLPGDDPWMR